MLSIPKAIFSKAIDCKSSLKVCCQLRAIMTLTGVNSKALKKFDPAPPPPSPGTFRLYTMRFCPWAERAALYLAKKQIKSEFVNINLVEKPEWFFAHHPQGKVPALEHDGKTVIESGLIPEYLDDIFPETSILPKDPFKKVQQKILVDQLSVIPQSFYGLVAVLKDPSLKEEKFAAIRKSLTAAEELLKDDYFGGSEAGFADYMTFPFFGRIFWMSHVPEFAICDKKAFPGTDYPKLTKWYSAMVEKPEVKATSQTVEHGLAFIKAYISGTQPDYDVGI